jgi:hypothetical protein
MPMARSHKDGNEPYGSSKHWEFLEYLRDYQLLSKSSALWLTTGNIFALHGGRYAACCEAHTNFADESASLKADNVRNEVVIIHESQEVLKTLSSLHANIFRNEFFS